jgi:hypothetical protein
VPASFLWTFIPEDEQADLDTNKREDDYQVDRHDPPVLFGSAPGSRPAVYHREPAGYNRAAASVAREKYD